MKQHELGMDIINDLFYYNRSLVHPMMESLSPETMREIRRRLSRKGKSPCHTTIMDEARQAILAIYKKAGIGPFRQE